MIARSLFSKLIIVFAIPLSVYANDHEAGYWSLGAFSTAENALVEKARLAGMIGLPIQIAVFAEGDMALFRLVIKKDEDPANQKKMILDSGVSPWSIVFDEVRLMEEQALSTTSGQNLEYFLVLAGFRSKDKADALLAGFNNSDGVNFLLQESELGSASWYRVVHGPFGQPDKSVKTKFNQQGFKDTWWVRSIVEEIDEDSMARSSAELEPRSETVVAPGDELSKASPVLSLTAPVAGESYLDYCIKKANQLERSVYCQDGAFDNLSLSERNGMPLGEAAVAAGDKALADFCALKATSEERDLYCNN
jgi:hypothetical protein